MNHEKSNYAFVGIDSHKKTHCAVVINCYFEKLFEMEFENVYSGFEDALKILKNYEDNGYVLVFGLEDVSAYGKTLAKFLNKHKYIVKHVNAELVANERASCKSKGKTDSIDAECVARVLFNRFDQLPKGQSQDIYVVLKQVVAMREMLTKDNTRLKNNLHTFLTDNYYDYNKFFASIDCKMALAFYEKYPSPSMLKGVTVEELNDVISEASNKKQFKGRAEKILGIIQAKGYVTSEYQSVRDLNIKVIVRQIRKNQENIAELELQLEDFLDLFDYRLQSFKGIDIVMAARLIAEIGDISRFPTAGHLASYAGISPTEYASGQNGRKKAKKRGNRELNSIFFRIALTVIMPIGKNKVYINPYFRAYYEKHTSLGDVAEQNKKVNRQALKRVERRIVNVIYSMMKNKRDYVNPPVMQSNENGTVNIV